MDIAVPADQDQQRSPILINRNFAWLCSGQAISIAGDFVFTAAMVVWIGLLLGRGQSWAPAAVSGAPIAASAPSLLLGPIAGVFADRWAPRRTMLWMDATRFIMLCLLLPILGRGAFPFMPAGSLAVTGQLMLAYSIIVLVSRLSCR